MSERIITLFGEEIVPEQVKAVGKSRAKKKPQEKKTETPEPEKETPEVKEEPKQEKVKKEIPEIGEQPKQEKVKETLAVNATVNAEREITEPESTPTKSKKEESVNLPDDWEGDKQYYSIGEVATLFKVKTSHIRFWTNEFKLKVRTTRKGDRLYTAEQIKELRAIHHLVKERGFTLSGAKAKLKSQNKMDVETVDLKQSLLQLRNKLVIIKNQLK